MKKVLFSIGLACAVCLGARATDYYQFDDLLASNTVVVPSTNSILGTSGVFGQTNLTSAQFWPGLNSLGLSAGRFGAVPCYNPIEQPTKVFAIYGYWTSFTNGFSAQTNGILTTLPAGGGTVIADLAPVSDRLGMWGGPTQVQGPTNVVVTFTVLQTTNPQVAYAFVNNTNFNNMQKYGVVDMRGTATNNFFVQRFWVEGNVQKSP